MRSYWSQDPRYSDSFVKKYFSRDRFEILKTALHLIDSDLFSKEDMATLQKMILSGELPPYFNIFLLSMDNTSFVIKILTLTRCASDSKGSTYLAVITQTNLTNGT